MNKTIAVLGSGSWGTALAAVLHANGHTVRMWGNNPEQVKEINEKHTNSRYLKNFTLAEEITATLDLQEALLETDIILFVVPTGAMRSVAQQVQKLLTEPKLIVHASKGLEQNTYLRISEVLYEEIPEKKRKAIVALSGPSHAEEVAKKDLTTITAASVDINAAQEVQTIFMNDYFRVYTNKDIIGVELGAALKNIIAIGAGVIHGLGFGDNAKAALMTRGLAEISRLGVAFGADPITFLGLSGVGDLIVTCTSVHSRNWRAGNMLGKGKDLDTVLDEMGMIVEGVYTTQAVYEMAQEKGIDMPITTAIYTVLYKGADVKQTVLQLMQREGKSE